MLWYPLIVLGAVLLIMPIARRWAVKAGFVDQPGGRKKHEEPVPPIGGLVIFGSVILISIVSGAEFTVYGPLYVGIAVLLLVGALDDYAHVSPWPKFAAQFIAAGLIVLWGDARVYQLGDLFGFGPVGLDWVSVPFSVVAAVLLINAVNLIDGLDGLAGGYAWLALFWMALGCAITGHTAHLPILMIVMAGVAGFLFYNMRSPFRARATVFLGDAGSMALGLCLAWFAMTLTQEDARALEPISVAWVLAIPIMDTCAQFYRRMRNGRHPFSPDRGHFHHHFIDAGITKGRATYLILAIGFMLGGLGFFALRLGVPPYVVTGLWITLLFVHMGVSYKPERYIRIFSMNLKALFLIGILGFVGLSHHGAAQADDRKFRKITPEKLLEVKPTENYGEDTPYDPLEAHMKAREQVRPSDRSRTSRYTTKGPAPDESVHIRTIRINNADTTGMDVLTPIPGFAGGQDAVPSPPISKIVPKPVRFNSEDQKSDGSMKEAEFLVIPKTEPIQKAASGIVLPRRKPGSTIPSSQQDRAVRIENLRIGRHQDKTRLVFDADVACDFSYTLDPQTRQSITVKIPDALWTLSSTKTYLGQPLLKGYKVQESLDGPLVVRIEFKAPVKVTMAEVLPPNTTDFHRIVVDVAAR